MFKQIKSFFHTNSRVYIKLENLNSRIDKKLTNRHKFIFIDNKVNNIYDTLYILNRKIDTLQRKIDILEKENNNKISDNYTIDAFETMGSKIKFLNRKENMIYENLKKKNAPINDSNEPTDLLLLYTNSGLG